MTDDRGQLLLDRIRKAQEYGPDANEWQRAINYYLGRQRGDEVAGMPRIQSTDVADMVHAVQAQLLPSFCGDQVCNFEADGPEDDAQARLESDAVNRAIMEDGRGYVVLAAAIKDALLLKAGIIKVWVEEETQAVTRRLQAAGPEAVQLLQAEADPELDDVEADGDAVTITARQKVRRLRLAPVDPLNFAVSPDHESVLLDACPLVAERWPTTRGELLELGYPADKVARIPAEDGAYTEINAQQVRARAGVPPQDYATDRERVHCWRVYETEADGTIKYTLLGGPVILETSTVGYIPYATGAALPEPHQFWGLSLYDRLKSVQDAKTMALRQWVANLAAGNLPRTAVNDNVHTEDLEDGRPSGIVRVTGAAPVGESIMPLPVLDLAGNVGTFMQYMDAVRADRGGAALQMATGEAQLMGQQVGSMGVDRIYSVQEQMSAMIARNLAETLLRSLFGLVHRALAEDYGQPMALQMAGQWVTVDPSQWRPRSRINVKQGLSPGERARKVAGLQGVVQTQMALLQAGMGGVMVDLPGLYRALLDLARAQELDSGQSYWTDPSSPGAQQAQQQQAQQAQQVQQLQAQLAMLEAQVKQAQVQIDQQRLALDAQKAREETIFKYRELAQHGEIEEAKLTASVTTDLIAAQQSARDAALAREQGPAAGDGGYGSRGSA